MKPTEGTTGISVGWIILLLVAPFFLNDVPFIVLQDSWSAFTAVDYGFRIAILCILAVLLLRQKLTARELGLVPVSPRHFAVATIGIAVVAWGLNRLVFHELGTLGALYTYPPYPSETARWIDLSFGLALVALTEELVFRGLLISALRRHGLSTFAIGLVSLSAFALAHWGKGIGGIAEAFAWGIIPTIYVLRSGGFLPLVGVHYLTNWVIFSLS